jgi:hypothetical protein
MMAQFRAVMPDLFRHPHATIFDVYLMWMLGHASDVTPLHGAAAQHDGFL